MPRIPFADLQARIDAILQHAGMAPERATLCARLIAETDRDGVLTHGVARLPRLLEQVRLGAIDLHAQPERIAAHGCIERWTGHRGPGNLAAYAAMERACELAQTHGLGCVALRDSTHWMRAGSYGWQAADRNCAALCWTNTMPNLPPWGSAEPTLGNNPLVLAVPRSGGAHIVLDFAMSQFSYGTLALFRGRGEPLPVPGGYNDLNELTTDPAAIELTQRALPIGFWKGSALSFVLDVLAAMLSAGNLVADIPREPIRETGVSQVFLAISPLALSTFEELDALTARAIDSLHSATPLSPTRSPRYPGEYTLKVRAESNKNGVLIEDPAWIAFEQLESRA